MIEIIYNTDVHIGVLLSNSTVIQNSGSEKSQLEENHSNDLAAKWRKLVHLAFDNLGNIIFYGDFMLTV